MWIYKTHFLGDGEFFEYDTFGGQGSNATQIALPYLESLLSFLEMDCAEWESLIQKACGGLEQFLATKDAAYTDQMMRVLGELSEKHVYFKLRKRQISQCLAQVYGMRENIIESNKVPCTLE